MEVWDKEIAELNKNINKTTRPPGKQLNKQTAENAYTKKPIQLCDNIPASRNKPAIKAKNAKGKYLKLQYWELQQINKEVETKDK